MKKEIILRGCNHVLSRIDNDHLCVGYKLFRTIIIRESISHRTHMIIACPVRGVENFIFAMI